MSQYNEGTVTVANGSQDVYGVYEVTVTNASGTFVAGESLSFATSNATGLVESWDSGDAVLKFTVQSTAQPVTNESLVAAAASGTVGVWDNRPSFVGNISWGDIFVPFGEERASYEVGTVPTRSHFTLTSSFASESIADTAYAVSTSFAPHNQVPYPESGDQYSMEIVKRSIIALDGMVVAASGLAVLSGSLQSQIDEQPTTFIGLEDTPSDYGVTTFSGSDSFIVACSGTTQVEYRAGNLSLEEVGRATYSAASTVEFVDVFDGESDYLIRIRGHWQPLFTSLKLRFSNDGGSTWESGAVYDWSFRKGYGYTDVVVTDQISGDDHIGLFNFNLTTGEFFGSPRKNTGDLLVVGMGDAGTSTVVHQESVATAVGAHQRLIGQYTTVEAVDAIQIYTGSTMTGEAILYRVIS